MFGSDWRSESDFSLMPQRGYGLQPRVAASATLGTRKKRNFNRNAVASFSQKEMHKADAAALRFRTRAFFTQGSRSGNPGLKAVAPLGHKRAQISATCNTNQGILAPWDPTL